MRHKLRTSATPQVSPDRSLRSTGGVTATLASQALPAMSGLMQSQRMTAYAERLASDLREARPVHPPQSRPCSCPSVPKGNTQCYVIYSGSGSCACSGASTTCDASATAHKTVALSHPTALNFGTTSNASPSAPARVSAAWQVWALDAKGNGIKHVGLQSPAE